MLLNSVINPVDRMRPIATPSCGQLPIRPRRRWLPHSIDSSTEPLHSPPTATPCRMRSRMSRIGAASPMVALPGRIPMKVVEIPIMSSVTIRVTLRPIRSPQ
jgi:hypothetical protein